MPRQVKAYACKYRCGQRVTTHFDDMIRHELNDCIKNPDIKACPTCKYDDFQYSEDTWHHSKIRFCKIGKRPENKDLIKQCEFWEHLNAGESK